MASAILTRTAGNSADTERPVTREVTPRSEAALQSTGAAGLSPKDAEFVIACVETDHARRLYSRCLQTPAPKDLSALVEAFRSKSAELEIAARSPGFKERAEQAQLKLVTAVGVVASDLILNRAAEPDKLTLLPENERRFLQFTLKKAGTELPGMISEVERAMSALHVSNSGPRTAAAAAHRTGTPSPQATTMPASAAAASPGDLGATGRNPRGSTIGVVDANAAGGALGGPPLSPPVLPSPDGAGGGGYGPSAGGSVFKRLVDELKSPGAAFQRYKLMALAGTVIGGAACGTVVGGLACYAITTLLPTMAAGATILGVGVGIWTGLKAAAKIYNFSLKWMAKKMDAKLSAPFRTATEEEERPANILARIKNARDALAGELGLTYAMKLVDDVVYIKLRMDEGTEPVRELKEALGEERKRPGSVNRATTAGLLRQMTINFDQVEDRLSRNGSEQTIRTLRPQIVSGIKTFLDDMVTGGNPDLLSLRSDLERAGVSGFSITEPGRIGQWLEFAQRHSEPFHRDVATRLKAYISTLPASNRKAWNDLLELDRQYLGAWGDYTQGLGIRQQFHVISLMDRMTASFDLEDPAGNPYTNLFTHQIDPATGKRQEIPLSTLSLGHVLAVARIDGKAFDSSGQLNKFIELASKPGAKVSLDLPVFAKGSDKKEEVVISGDALMKALNDWVANTPVPPGQMPIPEQWKTLREIDQNYAEAYNQYSKRDIQFDELMRRIRGRNEELAANQTVEQFRPQHEIGVLNIGRRVYDGIHSQLSKRFGGRLYSSHWRPDYRDNPDYDLATILTAECQVHKYIADQCDLWANEDQLTKNSIRQNIAAQIRQIKGSALSEDVEHDTSIVNQIIYRHHPLALFPRHFFRHTVNSDDPFVKNALPMFAVFGGAAHAAAVLPGLFSLTGSAAVVGGSYLWSAGKDFLKRESKKAGK